MQAYNVSCWLYVLPQRLFYKLMIMANIVYKLSKQWCKCNTLLKYLSLYSVWNQSGGCDLRWRQQQTLAFFWYTYIDYVNEEEMIFAYRTVAHHQPMNAAPAFHICKEFFSGGRIIKCIYNMLYILIHCASLCRQSKRKKSLKFTNFFNGPFIKLRVQ